MLVLSMHSFFKLVREVSLFDEIFGNCHSIVSFNLVLNFHALERFLRSWKVSEGLSFPFCTLLREVLYSKSILFRNGRKIIFPILINSF